MTATFGTVIHGTLRNEDLIAAFASELEDRIGDDHAYSESRKLIDKSLAIVDFDCEESSDILCQLFEYLNMFAPMYGYFGAHEGDGSDFGYWLSETAIADARHDGELVKVDNLGDVPEDGNFEFALVVNDHGNATLYQLHVAVDEVGPIEIWAIV